MNRAENWRWEHLSRAEADGMACVICTQAFDQTARQAKAVGSAAASGRPVFACAGACFGSAIARVKGWDHGTSGTSGRRRPDTGAGERW